MKKIVFVIPQLKTGGGLRVIIELSNLLVKDYDVHIVVPNQKDNCTFYINPKIKINKVGSETTNKIDKVKNIAKLYLELKKHYCNDIIITTDPIFSLPFIFWKPKNLYRYIQADDYRLFDNYSLIKSPFILKIYKFFTKISYKQNIIFLFNSDFSYRQFLKIRKKSTPKMIVHPAINQDIFYTPYKKQINQKLNLCLVARKNPMKRFQDFIDVWQDLKNDKELANKIDQIFIISHDDLSEYNLEDFKLIHPKNDKEMATIYQKSDIFISTSQWEGFGLPALEAINCGCSLLTSNAKGINEFANPKNNCLMYESGNKNELKSELIKLICDKRLIEKLQTNAKTIVKKFSWHISVKQLKQYI